LFARNGWLQTLVESYTASSPPMVVDWRVENAADGHFGYGGYVASQSRGSLIGQRRWIMCLALPLLIRRSVLERVGLFDEAYFLVAGIPENDRTEIFNGDPKSLTAYWSSMMSAITGTNGDRPGEMTKISLISTSSYNRAG